MSRFAYIWIIAAVGFAFWFHSSEEAERRKDINVATSHALYVGAIAGCKSNNKIVHEVEVIADKLHPSQRAAVQRVLTSEPCVKRANHILVVYRSLAGQ